MTIVGNKASEEVIKARRGHMDILLIQRASVLVK